MVQKALIKNALTVLLAAGAVSVSLAGTAWADPPADPGSGDTGIGAGGVPQRLGTFVDTGITPSANPSGDATPPGSVFISPLAKLPGNTPDAMGQFETGLWATHTLTNGGGVQTVWGRTPPGLAIKPLTPGCSSGRSAITDPASVKCVG